MNIEQKMKRLIKKLDVAAGLAWAENDPIWREYEAWAYAIKTRIEELKAEQTAEKAEQAAEKAEDEYYIRLENRLLGYGGR